MHRPTELADPYGNNTSTGTYAAASVMRYQASQQDNTGLYEVGDRYYDPTTQHWTQQDTVAGNFNNPTSTNRYTYADGNPIDNWAPTGHFEAISFVKGIGQTIGSVASAGGAVAAFAACPETVAICFAGAAHVCSSLYLVASAVENLDGGLQG